MTKISEIASKVRSGEKTALDFIQDALEKLESADEYHAIIELTSERAKQRAIEIDSIVKEGGDPGVLAGVPFVVKDNFLAFGAPTTAASKMLESFHSPVQATAVERLEAAGAICVGKSNMDAFAHGSSTENSYFGPSRNAHNKTQVPGGSSGGSAVVTALDIVPFALGTDTGGSIRQPASFNGVYGLKPTYGAVSRYGVVAMASSTDTIGCFAKSAEDVALVMSIMSGIDTRDMTTIDMSQNKFLPLQQKTNLRIGVLKETLADGLEEDVKSAVEQYISKLEESGHSVDYIDMPILKYALAMYYIIVPAEISSNLARFDGIRYGHRSEKATSLAELYGLSRDEGFMPENKRRILIGSYVLSSGFYDAYFQQAQKSRALLISKYNELFKDYDVLLSPVAPTTAFKIGQNDTDPMKMYLEDVMTVPPSLAGLPALSIPCPVEHGEMPVGVQLIGKQKSDNLLLSLAASMGAK